MRIISKILTAILFSATLAHAQKISIAQSDSSVYNKSKNCILCHAGIEPMHINTAVKIGCIECHGGNSQGKTRQTAHPTPRFADVWKTSANPEQSYVATIKESYEWIKFINPGDLRIADETCGNCHAAIMLRMKKSIMITSALLFGGASYNNGILPIKNYAIGESYDKDGNPQKINTIPPPSKIEMKSKGILPFIMPLPRWEISQPPDNFRSFERGGRIVRINPSEIGIPFPNEEPGRPDMKLSDRGLGTQLLISSPVLNLQKTRLNDPHLSFMGSNDHSGDYRSSGCTACHVIYANDRSPIHAGPYAVFGNRGFAFTADSNISRKESGHPIRHQFTSAIPSSQCMTCHMHQANGFVNTFFGMQMWDYESGAQWMYPRKEIKLSEKEKFTRLAANPEEAILRGLWADPDFLRTASQLNTKLTNTQFADYHGHGWIFRAVFKKDRAGNWLDKDGKIISNKHKLHSLKTIYGSEFCNSQECRTSPKAVHLLDIHAEKGMHCIDCHFEQDNHGDGKLYGEFHNAIEIKCQDCHGTINGTASLKTSGLASKNLNMASLFTTDGRRRFVRLSDGIYQRSMIDNKLEWRIPQVAESIDKNSPHFNAKSQRAKLISRDNLTFALPGNEKALAHSDDKMECYTCHNSWVTNCFGCHLPQQANWRKEMNHFEGEVSRNWTSYNPQVIRDDAFMVAINATTKGNKYAPARSSSAVMLSSRNTNREQIYNQQAPISAAGFSSQAFNPHMPHTVRKTETRTCADCHISARNDNNAWLAQVLLQGTGMVNFMGKYVYVGLGKDGIEAIKVTEDDEPQAVIGSYLHKYAYPDNYKKHQREQDELKTSYHHSASNIQSLQLRGEYLYTANGEDGFRVYDVANIDNKGFSERIVTSPVSAFGQNTHVDTEFATTVALPTNMPIDHDANTFIREKYSENQEQKLHDLYRYAYITDKYEGLILVDVMPLVDRDPRNNFLKRAVTFNPRNILNGAINITIAGNYALICADTGLVIVSINEPLKPKITKIIRLKNPKAISVQFRYAFVCDSEGLRVIDITDITSPQLLQTKIKLREAHDVYLARTYAYIATGAQGLAIVNIEKPDSIYIGQMVTLEGMNDVRQVKIASAYASTFAYVADGKNGLRVLQLTSPEDETYLGFSPRPRARQIAWIKMDGAAIALSRGMDRDRAVDESGNQVAIFGRLGSRPLTLVETKRLYWKDGKIWKVK